MSQSSLPPEIRLLPVADRMVLAEQIWESVVQDEASFELTDAQKQELDRRLENHANNPDAGSTWDEVKARMLRRS